MDKKKDLALFVSSEYLFITAGHAASFIDIDHIDDDTKVDSRVYALYPRLPISTELHDARYLKTDPVDEIVSLWLEPRGRPAWVSKDFVGVKEIYDMIEPDGLGGEIGSFIKQATLKKWELWNSKSEYGQGTKKMMLSCSSKGGDSGAGVMDAEGNFIGVQTSMTEYSFFGLNHSRSGVYVVPIPNDWIETIHAAREEFSQ